MRLRCSASGTRSIVTAHPVIYIPPVGATKKLHRFFSTIFCNFLRKFSRKNVQLQLQLRECRGRVASWSGFQAPVTNTADTGIRVLHESGSISRRHAHLKMMRVEQCVERSAQRQLRPTIVEDFSSSTTTTTTAMTTATTTILNDRVAQVRFVSHVNIGGDPHARGAFRCEEDE